MLGNSHFARGPLADAIDLDGDGDGVEDMRQGNFSKDKEGMDGAAAFLEMKSFLRRWRFQSQPPLDL